MKLTILNFTTGQIHIHNVSSQQEVMNYVNNHSEKTWMLSTNKEFKIINH
jgi:hypothetical protein